MRLQLVEAVVQTLLIGRGYLEAAELDHVGVLGTRAAGGGGQRREAELDLAQRCHVVLHNQRQIVL